MVPAAPQEAGLRGARSQGDYPPGRAARSRLPPNVSVEGWLDGGAWRYTEELAQFARGLAEADQRLWERAKDDPPTGVSEGVQRLEQELGRVPGVCPYGQSAVTHSGGCLSLPPGT
jgi:hypothetical protein